MENQSVKRDNNFNFIRLIFSSMVVYSHSFGLLNLTEPMLSLKRFDFYRICGSLLERMRESLRFFNA